MALTEVIAVFKEISGDEYFRSITGLSIYEVMAS